MRAFSYGKALWKGNLIAAGGDAKTTKGNGDEFVTAIMYLKPFKTLGVNLCANAESAQCFGPCLNSAGRGRMDSVQKGRLRKTLWFIRDRESFMAQLVKDTESFVKWCNKKKVTPCIRPNGTSDIRFELIPVYRKGIRFPNIFAAFPEVQFYDYTKLANRRNIPGNYHLVWSYSGANPKYAAQESFAKANGMNIAVVFRDKGGIPAVFLGLPTINGDRDDLRFLDPKGVVVALYAKGQAKQDQSGFVVDTQGVVA